MVRIKDLREDVIETSVEIKGEVIEFSFYPDFLTAEESVMFKDDPYGVAAKSIADNVTKWNLEDELTNDSGELIDQDGNIIPEGAEPTLVTAPINISYCNSLPATITMAIYNKMWEEISPN